MKKILIVFGTRPEAIKMAPIIREFEKHSQEFDVRVCVTGQHRQMLDQVLDLFQIEPYYDLDIMVQGQSLGQVVSSVLIKLDEVLKEFMPEVVLVQGDTATTMAASLTAYFQKIEVAHVEAGLRTGDIYSPWPEEVNRKVSSTIARWHFAPTEKARRNLRDEGIPDDLITVTGNTVIDALYEVTGMIQGDGELRGKLEKQFDFIDPLKRLILVTGHRRESFGEGFENICRALHTIASDRENVVLVFPVHLNPNVREPVNRLLSERQNIILIEPLEYASFLYLMSRSTLIVTDSGGVQEEAPSLNIPVLVTRDVTERPEAVLAGAVKVVGADYDSIVSEVTRLLDDDTAYAEMTNITNPYGDGSAAKRIVEELSRR